jgi:hypothetical protein
MITAEIRAETAMSAAASRTALTASPRPAFLPFLFPRPDFLFFGAAETLRDFSVIALTYHHYRQIRERLIPQPRERNSPKFRIRR